MGHFGYRPYLRMFRIIDEHRVGSAARHHLPPDRVLFPARRPPLANQQRGRWQRKIAHPLPIGINEGPVPGGWSIGAEGGGISEWLAANFWTKCPENGVVAGASAAVFALMKATRCHLPSPGKLVPHLVFR
jgi:hypothetical protein